MYERLRRIFRLGRTPDRGYQDPVAHNRQGCALLEQGHASDAETCFRAALASDSRLAASHSHLASALNLLGRFEEAENSSRRAACLDPSLADAYINLGNTMLFRGRYCEAIMHYVCALTIDAEIAEANIHMALLGRTSSSLPAAIHYYEEKLRCQPQAYISLVRLGLGYQATGKLDAAREKFEAARELRPELCGPWASLAVLYGSQGCPELSLALYRKALEINENPIWRSSYLFSLQYSEQLTAPEIYREHREWGRKYDALAEKVQAFGNAPDLSRKLRIGYLSGDFCQHAVANFMEPLLNCHDRARFEIHCYANVLAHDEVTARLEALSDVWLDVGAITDEDLCRKVRADGIDILVDLSGHTRGQRLGVMVRKAAPVQATYLGYPGTTGLAAIDYRISDATCDPPGVTDCYHSEKLLRLDRCFVTYQPPPHAPSVSAAPFQARGSITFGSFNNINKVNHRTIGLWADILRALPTSRIVIKHFATSHQLARKRILDSFAAFGIDAGRVCLLPAQPDLASHLALYREIDIALDCTPYNGTTTTCEAMWMGVPVITLAGDRHSARVGASLLGAAGLHEHIAATAEGYVKSAIDLALDTSHLIRLRDTLRQTMKDSPLLDARGFTASLEDAYSRAWQAWCQMAGH